MTGRRTRDRDRPALFAQSARRVREHADSACFARKEEERKMDLDQESNLVLSVLRGQDNRWHVTAQGFSQPLDSFGSPHEACAWALARAEPKRGRVFVEKALVDYSGSAAKSQER